MLAFTEIGSVETICISSRVALKTVSAGSWISAFDGVVGDRGLVDEVAGGDAGAHRDGDGSR